MDVLSVTRNAAIHFLMESISCSSLIIVFTIIATTIKTSTRSRHQLSHWNIDDHTVTQPVVTKSHKVLEITIVDKDVDVL